MSAKRITPGDVPAGAPALQDHLRAVLESRAFHGSRRSQQFLSYVVSKALQGGIEDLKERNLGIELFGRPAEYDTADDAIVRVTASDVRRRLRQYYSEVDSPIRIDLPSGSYAPQFRSQPSPPPAEPVQRTARAKRTWAWAILGGCAVVALAVIGWAIRPESASRMAGNTLPWSFLFRPGRQAVLVLSDPDISATQLILDSHVSLADYANGRYLPAPAPLPPHLPPVLRHFRGANVAAVDVGIALGMAGLAASGQSSIRTRPARSLKLADFKTADDFILLGSPRSNPWASLFQDQLDFYFAYDEAGKQEIIRNRRPRQGELAEYLPTARGWETGHSFAVLALVGNPNQSGKALLAAGANAEGTEAAGKLATDLGAMARILDKCGLNPAGPPRHFEILLEVRTMAGSSNTFGVKACHVLDDPQVP